MNNEKINLTASARLISQLGEQLISDELVALFELIKNSYDADAKKVYVEVDTKTETEWGIGKIVIEDNGNGMLPSIIKKGFLRLSTNFKKENRITPYYKRLVLGDKGIGRLSIQRLGKYVKVVTCPRIDRLESFLDAEDNKYLEQYNEFLVELDWSMLSLDIDFSLIQAQVSYQKNLKPKYGTRLEIYNITNQNFWNFTKRDENRIKKEIFGMFNPFIKGKSSDFNMYLTINGKEYTNERIDEKVIEEVSDIKVDFAFKDWSLIINTAKKMRYFKREVQKRIDIMKEEKFDLVDRKENYGLLANEYKINLLNMQEVISEYPYLKDIKLDIIDNKLAYPADFAGVIYASDFSKENQREFTSIIQQSELDENIQSYNDIKKVWDAANGVFLFRKDFRILPYGKEEWIGFTKKSQTYANIIYKSHTIAGYINIDGETSEDLLEQTNRQGLVENEYGNNFLRIIREVLLEVIVREDVDFRKGFTLDKSEGEFVFTRNRVLKFNKLETDDEVKQNLYNEVENTFKQVITNDNTIEPEKNLIGILKEYITDENEVDALINSSDRTVKNLLNALLNTSSNERKVPQRNIELLIEKLNQIKQVDNKISQKQKQQNFLKDEEIKQLYELIPMAGQGIIVESLTHELNRIDENIKSYASKTKFALENNIINTSELVNNQQLIIDETVYLRDQLNHLEPTYRKNRQIFEKISIKEFIIDTYAKKGPMSLKAQKLGVAVNVVGNTFIVEVNKGYLITVIDNIFLNSLYWIQYTNNHIKEIFFQIYEDGRIIIWDTGPGIHEKREKDLFNPFVSMKKDGRGLGLYIAKELLNSMNAGISLVNERRDNRLYKFEIQFIIDLEG
jgi:signal transduction histidine kinase